MATIWNGWYWHLGLASLLAVGGAIAALSDCAIAQVTPDVTLGAESSVVTPTNVNGIPSDQIDGGLARGANLFHSFDEFSIPTGGEAFFNNAADIQNIISRVTGGSISNIDGLIRANGTANLFLLNPNGIVFGPNASLNIGGSFVGSTASSLNFADGTQFSATAPQTTPLLTISVPIGLQYGGTAGSILNQSQATNSSGQRVGLQVQPGATLALLGGDVRLSGGNLQALGGRVELGGVASEGTVGLNVDGNNLSLSFPDGVARADVLLTNSAEVNVMAGGGGSIAVNARNLDFLGGSRLSAGIGPGLGAVNSQAGDITLDATGVITISQSSRIANEVGRDKDPNNQYSIGNAGDINIQAGSLFITDSAPITQSANLSNYYNGGLITDTRGRGDGGDISVQANDSVSVANSSISSVSFEARFLSGKSGNISVQTNGSISLTDSYIVSSTYSGDAGNISVQANGSVSIKDNNLSSITFGQGNAGNISVQANGVSLENSVLSSDSGGRSVGAQGNGGDISIFARSVSVTDGSLLTTRARSTGNAGKILVNASDFVEISGRAPFPRPVSDWVQGSYYTSLLTSVEERATGLAGKITINTDTLRVADGATLGARSRVASNGGDININANVLEVTDGGQLLTTASSSGDAGNINVNVADSITISGSNSTFREFFNQVATGLDIKRAEERIYDVGSNGPDSGMFASTTETSTGQGGDLRITTGQLIAQDGAQVTVSSKGTGNAGNLEVTARSIELDNRGNLTAETASGQGGNIRLQAQDLLLLRNNSEISATAGTAQSGGDGGNIRIDAPFIVAVPAENSDITANAFTGAGGSVEVRAQGIFGTQFRDRLTELSDITASSKFGVSGTVEINNPDVDPTQGLVELPAEIVDASNSFAQGCPASVRSGESKFIITGRGGLPPSPTEPLRGDNTLTNWSTLEEPEVENRSSAAPSTNSTIESAPTTIVEANGWVKGPNGEVTLVATAPTANIDIPWLPESSCNAPGQSM